MAVSNLGVRCAAAFGGGIGNGQPMEDSPTALAVWAATEATDSGGTREFSVSGSNVVTIGLVDIPGKDDHTTKWTPGAGGDGTWDGLQRRS